MSMNEETLWKDALGLVRLSLSAANFSTWFTNTFILAVKENGEGRQIVEIACPSSFAADTLEKRYFGLIQDALNQVSGVKNDLVFSIKQRVLPAGDEKETPLFAPEEKSHAHLEEALKKSRVPSGFSFENFAVSSSNQMAWAAAEAVSKNPGGAYNPLFLWGGVGVGKTHLMLAVADRVLAASPKERVLYCTGEEFTTEIVEAIRTKTTGLFKKKYRDLRLLLVDDIQFIAGKITVQEEFFHTFNTLLRAGGQVVLTSDVPPSDIPKLEGRLKSRFEAGLIVDISPPDFELRTAITLIKAKEIGIELPMEAAQTIAANLDSPRRIKGFLVRLTTEINGSGEGISGVVERLIHKTNGEARPRKVVLPQEVVGAVSNYFSLGKRGLLGTSRAQRVALPRQILMYLLRSELGISLQEVGRLVGGKDHTTVMYAVDKISGSLSTNSKLREDILRIKQSVFG